MAVLSINEKIKDRILEEFNIDLYKKFCITVSDSNHFFGYYDDYLYELIEHVYTKYGPSALREEMKYIVEYLEFLFMKLENNSLYEAHILIYHYFKKTYKHYTRRSKVSCNQLALNFGAGINMGYQ